MPFNPLPDLMLESLVRTALAEDLGRAGDITTNAVVAKHFNWHAALVARQPGVMAGIDCARLAFKLFDPALAFETQIEDGGTAKLGGVVATVKGSARSILTAERTALNFLCHLSGIATATHALVEAAKPHGAKICDTRKTAPGLRALEKYAVRAGGGVNHRFGLDDAILIKDNHLALAGGVRPAVARARENLGHLVKIEVEVDSLQQLAETLDLPIDAVLLDNMDPPTLKKAVDMVGKRFVTEASGRVTPQNVGEIAKSGVDIISSGWVTHSAPIMDIGLDPAA
ncbi:MAG TPA: carboxylating nicotinate-nucleotide diphosphorylase [Alphaproteobacteria bacterium]|nr:carboxylating nicotinate-nucleotide diphosphorylase [Alphaproteobacteria bacterium]